MYKRFAILGAGLACALLGASTAQGLTPEQVEDVAATVEGPIYSPRIFKARTPAPAKPIAEQAVPRQVVLRQAPLVSQDFYRFIERPGRRKVKYGRHRWVLIG
jgi:hypothetical protein